MSLNLVCCCSIQSLYFVSKYGGPIRTKSGPITQWNVLVYQSLPSLLFAIL